MDCTTHENLRDLLTSSIINLCNSCVDFSSEVTVEGLIGITVDRKDVILVNIKEVMLASQSVHTWSPATLQTEPTCNSPSTKIPCPPEDRKKTKRKAPPHKLPYKERKMSDPKQDSDSEDVKSFLAALEVPENLVEVQCVTDSPPTLDFYNSLGSCEAAETDNQINGELPEGETSQMSGWDSQGGEEDQGESDSDNMELSIDISVDGVDSGLNSHADFLTDDAELKNNSQDTLNDNPSPSDPVYMLPAPPKRVVRKHDPELIAELVFKIRAGTMTLADAARKYNIPRPTLSDKVRGRTPITKDKQNRRVLDPEEEEELVVWCLERASQGEMPSMIQFMKELDQYLVNHGRNSLANSKEWTKSFLRRHPELTDSGITFSLQLT